MTGRGVLFYVVFEEGGIAVFRGLEKSSSDIWTLIRLNVSLWVSMAKLFFNYSLGLILLD